MKRTKHLLLWSSLGTLLLLALAASREHFGQDWRRMQRAYAGSLAPEQAAQFQVQLRQIVVPALKVTDRCVSCHLGMAPGETSIPGHPVFGPHPRMAHEPGEFGCTVCHGGQGRATETEAAHGAVPFWPEPMIPQKFASAGCGSCHTHLSVPNRNLLQKGEALFERYDCLACHSVDGRGGTLRPFQGAAMAAPDLSTVGATGYRPQWYEEHLDRSRRESSRPWKESFGEIPDPEREALAAYLNSRVGAPGLVRAKSVFHGLGCRGCHAVNGVGGDDGPDLSLVGQKDPGQLNFRQVPQGRDLSAWMSEHLRAPAKLVSGSQMPYLGLPEEDILDLTFYLFSLRRSSFPEAYWPRDKIEARYLGKREFATDGATLYATFCAACHGSRGEGMRYPGMAPFPGIANPDFLALASDQFLRETIRRGRPGRRMPAWGEKEGGLRPEEIDHIVDYLRLLGGGIRPSGEEPRRQLTGDPERGKDLYQEACAGCHGTAGEGGEGPALANRVFLETASDQFLLETIRRGRRGTTMPAFSRPSTIHRLLTQEEMESIVTYIRSWENQP